MTRVTRGQVLSVRCPKCGQDDGYLCRFLGPRVRYHEVWRVRTVRPHRERRQAFLDKQAGEARESEE